VKTIYRLFALSLALAAGAWAQGLTIGSGTTFSLGGATLSLPNNYSDSGTFVRGGGTMVFSGAAGNQTISSIAVDTLQNLTVNKAAGNVLLNKNIAMAGNMIVTLGALDMNGDTITMGTSALLSETPGNTVKGRGEITGALTIAAVTLVNPFGLGATIFSPAGMGPTVINRGHVTQAAGADSSILRYFDIVPAVNTGLGATLVFHYDKSELNSHLNSGLFLYRSTDTGKTWIKMGGALDTAAKTVTLSGITSFSRWTLATVPPAPGATALVSPFDNAANVIVNPTLVWNRLSTAVTYSVQVAADSLFSSLKINDSLITDTSKTIGGLANDSLYYWRVSAENAGGYGVWSAVQKFTTIIAIPSIVTLKTPANGDTVKADSVFLAWATGTPKVDRYRVDYATDSLFAVPTIDSAVSDTVKIMRGLQNNTTIWWRVRAHSVAGWGAWSAQYSFAVKRISVLAGLAAIPKTFSFTVSNRTGFMRYALPKAEDVSLRLYSLNGQLQSEPVNKHQGAGYYTVSMQKSIVAAGSYLVVFRAGDYHQKKMIFLMR
jgi:hypothetical protein